MPTEVTDDTFDKEVLGADKPAIVDFWAPWCGPCRILGPNFAKLSEEMTEVKFCKLNVDENNGTAMKYGVRSIPTLIVFKEGKVAGSMIGAMPKDMLKEKLEGILG